MQIHFYKYHGTGNDFVLIDNRTAGISLTQKQAAHICDRHFGIGADGLMLLQNEDGYDFRMVYYNSDGNESTMCGNGGRCITAFSKKLGIITEKAKFIAIDGPHDATIDEHDHVSLQMQDVGNISVFPTHAELNTGSPHHVVWVDDVQNTDVFKEGRLIRNMDVYQPQGINVNFVQKMDDSSIWVRTYERGVEDETLSCGTGVTAAAIATNADKVGAISTDIQTPGGKLNVSFMKDGEQVTKVILSGPAQYVFEGDIEV